MVWADRNNVVFTNGVFDVLHVGHFNILHECRRLAGPGGFVYVGLDSDEKVKKDKGENRPFFSFEERKSQILKLVTCANFHPLVQTVFTFNTNEELHELIEAIKPDIVVKGEDWKDKEVIGSDISKVMFAPLVDGISTTSITNRVSEKFREQLETNFRNELMQDLSWDLKKF